MNQLEEFATDKRSDGLLNAIRRHIFINLIKGGEQDVSYQKTSKERAIESGKQALRSGSFTRAARASNAYRPASA
jgi:hypothetical protein